MENKKKELLSNLEKQKESKISRRGFLKRTAYHAPVLIAMGQLVKPENAQADGTQSSDSSPDGHPDNWW
jgi:hypothetical protein